MSHTPVLLKQMIENLEIKPNGLYIDATFGEGGYSQAILEKRGKVLAIDWDEEQIKKNKNKKIILVNDNFANIEAIAKKNNFFPVDGIVFDLGLSMRQIDEEGRGFSYKKLNEHLDMRINKKNQVKAKDLIKKLTEDELYQLLSKNSEEIKARIIAHQIKKTKKMETVEDLIKAIDKAVGFSDKRVYSRIFQALRIAINNELENLEKGLEGAIKILKKDGRLLVVTFHSVEDRLVKNFVRKNKLKLLKIQKNSSFRSFERSAKLRLITL